MSNSKWVLKEHHEKPNWGEGDYDEYYEVVNERGDALQATGDYDALHAVCADLNEFEGELRITTALEINLHCETQLQKMEIETLKAENSKMRNALERAVLVMKYYENLCGAHDNERAAIEQATEALKTT